MATPKCFINEEPTYCAVDNMWEGYQGCKVAEELEDYLAELRYDECHEARAMQEPTDFDHQGIEPF